MELSRPAIDVVSRLLNQRTGQQFESNRHWRMASALAAPLRQRGIASSEMLIHRLSQDKVLAQDVVEALLNNETYFFRDGAVFEQIATRVLPGLVQRRQDQRSLAIWSAGCSTGQEALSLAMLVAEQRHRLAGWSIDILGTDVSAAAIAAARRGVFTQFEIQRGLGVGRMLASFESRADGWHAADWLKQMVRFEMQNLLDGPPAVERFDLILCRNVLLYFDQATRQRAFANLARALAPGGLLVLGGGETILGQTDRLVADRDNPGFYRHVPDLCRTG